MGRSERRDLLTAAGLEVVAQQRAFEGIVTKTTTFECGCVTAWRVKRLEPTPLTCPVHGAIWAHTESEPR